MAPTMKRCEKQMAAIERVRARHRQALVKLNAKHRVWAERLRAAARREARVEAGAKVRTKFHKMKGRAPVRGKRPRGRPTRWPGLCHACMRRHEGEAGGPKHLRTLCAKTQAHIKRLAK